MVQLDGTYELISEENYLEYLKSLGLNDEQAQKQAIPSALVIKPVSGNSITIAFGDKEVAFPLGEESEHSLAAGHTVWTVVIVSGDTITFKTKLTEDGSLTEEKIFKITDSGLTSTSTNSKGVKAVRKYKRV